jgi:hypothetical protein
LNRDLLYMPTVCFTLEASAASATPTSKGRGCSISTRCTVPVPMPSALPITGPLTKDVNQNPNLLSKAGAAGWSADVRRPPAQHARGSLAVAGPGTVATRAISR